MLHHWQLKEKVTERLSTAAQTRQVVVVVVIVAIVEMAVQLMLMQLGDTDF